MKRTLLVMLAFGSIIHADENTEAAAALALARARATAEVTKAKPKHECLTDLSTAMAKARKEAKALVCWVGMQCTDLPEVRAVAPDKDAVHCHLSDWQGDRGKYLVVKPKGSDDWYRIRKPTADELKRTLATRPAKPMSYDTALPIYQPVYAFRGATFGVAGATFGVAR